ncbi:hypothetical protein L6270_02215 [Candidatus Parcubacteria bacterium]|nr:hypothetical protein [Patescibacteria group bacterium]MBU4309471.1 hypothetical protein [Patescibacteria group bacterium]MBU4432610.1 hypothetical protein [Patescibacteria group bacterium]MBU4577177.1 hypothetical protein [Patescibacteria group bacterium]MCG2696825.1 hypothetical protein [Candidatus Parcubacteria bacterium]
MNNKKGVGVDSDDEDALFRAQVFCSEIVDGWIGKKCECGEIITEGDIKKILGDKDLVMKNHDPDSEPMCYECYKERCEQLERFEGDYNDLHPNETVEQFHEHEDR